MNILRFYEIPDLFQILHKKLIEKFISKPLQRINRAITKFINKQMQATSSFFVKIKNSTTFNFGADLMRNGIPWCPRYPIGKNLKDS